MTVREFMKDADKDTYMMIMLPVLKEDGNILRYEPFRDCCIHWPDIGGIDAELFDRKIERWYLVRLISSAPCICFCTTKGE